MKISELKTRLIEDVDFYLSAYEEEKAKENGSERLRGEWYGKWEYVSNLLIQLGYNPAKIKNPSPVYL